jgi:uncharacterized protein YecE (DUF72 family)
MQLYVGTSGFSYKEWKGTFYPSDLPAKRMLSYYGERFPAVEINNTFHRMPKSSVLEAWAAEVPAGFRFVLKAPQRITHLERLKNTSGSLAVLLEVSAALNDRLGPLLFQLPPGMKKDMERLRAFLSELPQGRRAAFEFRNASWFDEEVFGLMRNHGAALCIAEADTGPDIPVVATADWGYLRLRREDYGDAELIAWAERTRAMGWREAFVFFKHEDAGKGPAMAGRFRELFAKKSRGGRR